MEDKHFFIKASSLIATGLGVGKIKKAPGTAGTLLAWIIASIYFIFCGQLSWSYLLIFIIILSFGAYIAIEICKQNLDEFTEEDPQQIVIDEICGYFMVLLFIPLWSHFYLFLALVLFRFFDILKPSIVGWADRQENNFSILLDDLLAGVFAGLALTCIRFIYILI